MECLLEVSISRYFDKGRGFVLRSGKAKGGEKRNIIWKNMFWRNWDQMKSNKNGRKFDHVVTLYYVAYKYRLKCALNDLIWSKYRCRQSSVFLLF